MLALRDLKVSLVALECQELQDLMGEMASLVGRELRGRPASLLRVSAFGVGWTDELLHCSFFLAFYSPR